MVDDKITAECDAARRFSDPLATAITFAPAALASSIHVLPDMGGAVVVHDRYQNYDAIPGLSHQLCCQHLLRDLEYAAQQNPDAHWPIQAAEELQGLVHAANTARAQGLPATPSPATPGRHPFPTRHSPPNRVTSSRYANHMPRGVECS